MQETEKLNNPCFFTSVLYKTVTCAFQVIHVITYPGKPFNDGQLIIDWIIAIAEEMYPKKLAYFKSISLSANIVAACQIQNLKCMKNFLTFIVSLGVIYRHIARLFGIKCFTHLKPIQTNIQPKNWNTILHWLYKWCINCIQNEIWVPFFRIWYNSKKN